MSSNLAGRPSSANAPPVPEQRWLAYHYIKLGRWTYFGWWTPQFQSRDAMITSTHNLADEPTLANGPPAPEKTCIKYQYTKLGRWTYFGWWTPLVPEQIWLAHHYTNLGRWTYFGWWTPGTRAEMAWIPVHNTLQMNWLCPMDPPR